MNLVNLSTFMNQHQFPISKELYAILGENYKYIALNKISDGRKKLGQEDMNNKYSFVWRAYESGEQMEYAKKMINDCDVLLAGHCQDYYFIDRLKNGSPVIKTSERFFKESPTLLNRIKHFVRAKRHFAKFQDKPFYFLCASAYTSSDVNKYTNFQGKTYKWGYFTECKRYENIENLISKKKENSILWVGRFLDWKHPEIPVLVAKRLKDEGYKFKLNIIGTGDLEEEISSLINDYDLADCVELLGVKKSEEVRYYMEKSQIYMFTSNRQEGWGAVLNESMNSGCAVVANSEIGSVSYLMKNNINGLVYKGNNFDEVYKRVKYLLDNPEQAKELGKNAYYTIINEWSPEIAAKRLLQFCEQIKEKGQCDLFEDGPCSRTQ